MNSKLINTTPKQSNLNTIIGSIENLFAHGIGRVHIQNDAAGTPTFRSGAVFALPKLPHVCAVCRIVQISFQLDASSPALLCENQVDEAGAHCFQDRTFVVGVVRTCDDPLRHYRVDASHMRAHQPGRF